MANSWDVHGLFGLYRGLRLDAGHTHHCLYHFWPQSWGTTATYDDGLCVFFLFLKVRRTEFSVYRRAGNECVRPSSGRTHVAAVDIDGDEYVAADGVVVSRVGRAGEGQGEGGCGGRTGNVENGENAVGSEDAEDTEDAEDAENTQRAD
jgi:hypothetical protein